MSVLKRNEPCTKGTNEQRINSPRSEKQRNVLEPMEWNKRGGSERKQREEGRKDPHHIRTANEQHISGKTLVFAYLNDVAHSQMRALDDVPSLGRVVLLADQLLPFGDSGPAGDAHSQVTEIFCSASLSLSGAAKYFVEPCTLFGIQLVATVVLDGSWKGEEVVISFEGKINTSVWSNTREYIPRTPLTQRINVSGMYIVGMPCVVEMGPIICRIPMHMK